MRRNVFFAMLAVVSAVLICVPAIATMSDEQFTELCVDGSRQQIISALENGANINARDSQGVTALMYAASFNNFEATHLLLERGADLRARDDFGVEALGHCAMSNHDPEMISFLVNKGSNTNAKSNNGNTVLMWASNSNKASVVRALLAAGADINAADPDGFTPLIWASFSNSPEVVEVLLDAGANALAKDKNGKSVIEYAVQNDKLRGSAAYERLRNISR